MSTGHFSQACCFSQPVCVWEFFLIVQGPVELLYPSHVFWGRDATDGSITAVLSLCTILCWFIFRFPLWGMIFLLKWVDFFFFKALVQHLFPKLLTSSVMLLSVTKSCTSLYPPKALRFSSKMCLPSESLQSQGLPVGVLNMYKCH